MKNYIVKHDDFGVLVWVEDLNGNRLSEIYDFDIDSEWSYIQARDRAIKEAQTRKYIVEA